MRIFAVRICLLYKDHGSATSRMIDAHHICPKSWFLAAGQIVDTPMIDLCPNCHYNVHEAIDDMVMHGGPLPLTIAPPPRVQRLALQAFTLAQAKGLKPAKTL